MTKTMIEQLAMDVFLEIKKDTQSGIKNFEQLQDVCDANMYLEDTYTKLYADGKTQDQIYSILNRITDEIDSLLKDDPKEKIGQNMEVFRNQGDRDATIVSTSGDDILVEYEMPNGTTALNIIRPDGSYKTIPYAKLQSSKKWMQNLDQGLLINNPQSGEKFKINK